METKGTNIDKGLCIGIDLGTTNSVIATVTESKNNKINSKVIEVPRADEIMHMGIGGKQKLSTRKTALLPSCVYYQQENNFQPIVGDFAKKQYLLRPQFVARSIKSQMGFPEAKGLDDNIRDKTPADISSRILQHLLTQASKICRCEINEAVITVPANFDSAMCKATLMAAKKAGINVYGKDGSDKAILLSEPNAVLYDLVNQIKNGEIPECILDLSKKRNIMVFDLGGGTLDITLHEVSYREQTNDEVISAKEIATNRYTLLGGDDFDELIANDMYEKYINQYSTYPDVVKKIQKEKDLAMALLRAFAEGVKLDLNSNYSNEFSVDDSWGDDEDIEIDAGGNMGSIGYSLDITYTKEELEEILSPLLGNNLSFKDYKKIDIIKNTQNIIFPILDVLHKATIKNKVDDITVDAVILNGGMSKFYLIRERLKKFFGFDPICATDPDLSVARGAAIYHYYLQKYNQIESDMRKERLSEDISDKISIEKIETTKSSTVQELDSKTIDKQIHEKASTAISLDFGNRMLNDGLYLGVKNGAVHLIIPTGSELPYQSEVMTGFKIDAGQNKVSIPIKSKNLDGTYRTIATGELTFHSKYPEGAYISFSIYMSPNKIIYMNAWASSDDEGRNIIEDGSCEIVLGQTENSFKNKFIPPSGTFLNVHSEIHSLEQLCNQLVKHKGSSEISKRISNGVNTICTASNREDFADIILQKLQNSRNFEFKMRLYIIARKIGIAWTDKQLKKLSDIIYNEVASEVSGFQVYGPKVNTNLQAIYAASICKNTAIFSKIANLRDNPRYTLAFLYVHSRTKTSIAWIYEMFRREEAKALKGDKSYIQNALYAIGVALKKDDGPSINFKYEEDIVYSIVSLISNYRLNSAEMPLAFLAIGWICDQRYNNNMISEGCIQDTLKLLNTVMAARYPSQYMVYSKKAVDIAYKMINSEVLSAEDEKYLLTKLELV